MNWVIDVLLVATIVFLAVKNCISGIMHTVYHIGKFIAAILSAIILGKPLGTLISNRFMANKLSDLVYGKISEYVSGEKLSEFFADIPEGFAKIVKLFGVDLEAICQQYSNAENSEAVLRDMSQTISGPIANMISAIIAYVLIFVVVFVVLTIVFKGLEKIKIPVLTGVDKILGLVFGLALGVFSASLLATAVYSVLEFISAVNESETVMNIYNDSYVFKFIYNLKIFEFVRNLL